MKTKFIQFLLIVITLVVLVGCSSTVKEPVEDDNVAPDVITSEASVELEILPPPEGEGESEVESMNPIVLLSTTMGDIKIELYEDLMPITAGNFKKLVQEGFYNGLTFHRVIDSFMIQGGCPNGDGTGNPGYYIDDEFVDDPKLSNTPGTVAMANAGPNTGGSQFFINLVDNSFLDWNKPPSSSKHPVFGKVIEGMDVIESIAKVDKDANDKPLTPVVINSATIV